MDKEELISRAKHNCRSIFEVVPQDVLLSPVGFIFLGDHTHYTESMLIGGALNVYSAIICRKRDDDKIKLQINDGPITNLSVNDLSPTFTHFNTLLLIEILEKMKKEELLNSGFDCYIEMDIPKCVGLGYYSSIIMGFIFALNEKLSLNLNNPQMINIGFNAWKEKIGKIANKATLQCTLQSKKDNLLYSDLRREEPDLIPFNNEKCRLVIFDTTEEISNPRDICNERIEECEVGVKGLRLYIWGIKNLRDIKPDFLARHIHMIPRRVYNRCLYNVNERIRVEESRTALMNNNISEFCRQTFLSHEDLSSYYEISTEKLNYLVEKAAETNLVEGAKMISCSSFRSIYSLIQKGNVEEVLQKLSKSFKTGYSLEIIKHEFELANGIININ